MRATPIKGLRQRRFGGPDHPVLEQGDCWATAVASFAGLSAQDRNELHRRISISRAYWGSDEASRWWDITERFLAERGRLGLTAVDEPDTNLLYLATGHTPRGLLHTVVAWGDGSLWWDPNPDGDGMIEVVEWVCWYSPDVTT